MSRNPGAGVACCRLRVIDRDGLWVHEDASPPQLYPAGAVDPGRHGRGKNRATAGRDLNTSWVWQTPGLMTLNGQNLFVSQNQLLYRRGSIGGRNFRTDLGSTADVLFNLQTGLAVDVAVVPSTWAAWRLHPGQFSAAPSPASKSQVFEEMVSLAVQDHVKSSRSAAEASAILSVDETYRQLRQLRQKFSCAPKTRLNRWIRLAGGLILRPRPTMLYIADRFTAGQTSVRHLARRIQWLNKRFGNRLPPANEFVVVQCLARPPAESPEDLLPFYSTRRY